LPQPPSAQIQSDDSARRSESGPDNGVERIGHESSVCVR
jgi:hypothetical protein